MTVNVVQPNMSGLPKRSENMEDVVEARPLSSVLMFERKSLPVDAVLGCGTTARGEMEETESLRSMDSE